MPITYDIISCHQQELVFLQEAPGFLADKAQGGYILSRGYNPCQMEVPDVLTIKHVTWLPVQEDEELYVLQSQMMKVIYRLKWLQGHPRKLTGRKRKSQTQHIVLLPTGNSTYKELIK